jgi:hypothetical protein
MDQSLVAAERWNGIAYLHMIYSRIYAADVQGDYREEVITIDEDNYVKVFWNEANNPNPEKPRYWAQQHYRRQKQNWNYYSPESQGMDSTKLKEALDYLAENSGSDGTKNGISVLCCARSRSGMARYIYHCTTRNNILHVRETDTVCISYRGGDNDLNYDLHSKDVPEGHESHGIRGIPTYVPGADFDFATKTGNFQLDKTSAGYDAGESIPNFSDGYTGVAPDMGAHENGWDSMKFGVNAVFIPPTREVGRSDK